jgi:hypothetical protein
LQVAGLRAGGGVGAQDGGEENLGGGGGHHDLLAGAGGLLAIVYVVLAVKDKRRERCTRGVSRECRSGAIGVVESYPLPAVCPLESLGDPTAVDFTTSADGKKQ